MKKELTLVIPCKNEEGYIGFLLSDIYKQRGIEGVRIIIADAQSTDSTIEIIKKFNKKLNIEIIKGGLPAVGRNSGLQLSKTEWTLFMDSDARIYDNNLIVSALSEMKSKNYKILTCKLNSEKLLTKLTYRLANMFIYLSKFDRPFAVGIFTMVKTKEAKLIGGFPEWAMHCEDYLFSSEFRREEFLLLDKYIWSDDRRFRKMSWWKMVVYFIKNIIMRNNKDYFRKNVNYWS